MPQPTWLALAWADLGVAETPGSEHTARVLAYYADAGHPEIKDDETAWCAAFLGACLERAGLASTRSLMARSYVGWGEPLDEFRPGAIAVLSRTADPTLGHVGFLVGETADQIFLLGGNQNNRVSVESFPRTRLLGLRWPANMSPVIADAAGEAHGDPGSHVTGDSLFDRALAHVLDMEGGWTDDPYDPGGPTNYGITLAVYARERGVEITSANLAQLKAELRSISPDIVRRIYDERYWQPASCSQMPPALAFFHFDAAVNQGVTGAARLLQEAIGAFVDGEIGPETLGKAAGQPIAAALARYAEARRRHYRSLSTFWRFGRGWLARVDRTLAAALAIIRATPSTSQQEQTSMTEPTSTTETPDSKWWGRSLTIWGVIITTLSTVLPVVAPVIGLDITAELVRQLGDQVVVVVQAAGGLAGTILTIWGRARATTSLERRQVTMNL